MQELPELPYDYDALEPFIDEQTMRIHHGKHHAGYTSKYNAAVQGTSYEEQEVDEILKTLDTIPEGIRGAIRNNGGGYSNHKKFWEWMTPPKESGTPSDDLKEEIKKAFGSVEDLKQRFKEVALRQFGSGWAWLVIKDGTLDVLSTSNQDTPLSQGLTPILGLDVWEHGYYLKYKNDRAAYIDAWWNVVNWKKVSADFQESL